MEAEGAPGVAPQEEVPATAPPDEPGVVSTEAALPGEGIAPPQSEAPESRTVELLALIDRLEELLQRSSLDELEVAAGETTLVLRTPDAVAPALDGRTLAALAAAAGDGGPALGGGAVFPGAARRPPVGRTASMTSPPRPRPATPCSHR